MLTATECHQLIKLTFLFEHFQHHKTESKDLTIWAFIEHHYAHENTNDGHDAEDNKLPFKSSEVCLANSLVAVFHTPGFYCSFEPFLIDTTDFNVQQENFLSSSVLNAIWQPPKFS